MLDEQATECLQPIYKVIKVLRQLSILANGKKNGLNSDNLGEGLGRAANILEEAENDVASSAGRIGF